MQDTIQEITEKVHVLEMDNNIEKPYPGRAKDKRKSAKPDALSIGVIIFFILAFSMSWMANMLFLKELAISGSIIFMILIFRFIEQSKIDTLEYRQNWMN